MDRAGLPVDIYAVLAVDLSNGALASIAISVGHPRPHTSVTDDVRVWRFRGAIHIVDGSVYVEDSDSNMMRIDKGNFQKQVQTQM